MADGAKSVKFKSYHVFSERAYRDGIEEKETVIFGIRSGVLSGHTHTHTQAQRVERKIKYIAVSVSRKEGDCKRNRNGEVSPSWLCIFEPFIVSLSLSTFSLLTYPLQTSEFCSSYIGFIASALCPGK
jgi:hypothetical protein